MRTAVLFSGGKDSTRTVHWCHENGYDVKCLVTMIPKRDDSWMFHYPNIKLAKTSAKAIGIKHVEKKTSGIKEEEVEDMKKALSKLDVEAVACGGIASNYQRMRIEKVCNDLELKLIAPFWGTDPVKFMQDTINLGFNVVFVGVYAEGLDKNWLGRKLDEQSLKELIELNKKYCISIVLEGGEGETYVLDGPVFKKRIKILVSEIVWEGMDGYLDIRKVGIEDKRLPTTAAI